MTQFIENMYRKFHVMNVDTGLLLLRIGVGAVFIFTGWMKASDMNSTIVFFTHLGFVPFWAYLVTAVELLGGIVVLLGIGVYTRVSAKLLAIVMLVALYITHTNPAVAMTPFIMFFATVALLYTGPGKYSIVREKNS